MAIFEVCQGAKAVPLDLKEPVRMGKRWRTANWHGLKLRQHLSNMIRDFWLVLGLEKGRLDGDPETH